MSPKSQIAIISVIIAIALAGWYWLYTLTKKATRDYNTNQSQLAALRKEKSEDSLKAIAYQQERDNMFDSLMRFKVENGQLSIELNRKESQLQQATFDYKMYRAQQEVSKALNMCDSIVYTYVPDYMHADSLFHVNNDSLIVAGGSWLVKQDSTIDNSFNKRDSLYAQLDSAIVARGVYQERAIAAEKKEKKAKRKFIPIAAVSALIGIVLIEIFGK